MDMNCKGQAPDLALCSRLGGSVATRQQWQLMGFRKPVTSPLAFRPLLVVLCEPQLSQSRRRKSYGGSGIYAPLLTYIQSDYGEPMCSKPVRVSAAPASASF